MSHEFMSSFTEIENGEDVTYAEPTHAENPWKQKKLAGFKGPDQIEKAEHWIQLWSGASGNRMKQEFLMEQADIPMPAHELKQYLDWSTPKAIEEQTRKRQSLKIPTK